MGLVSFLVDGFNMYHSAIEAYKDLGGVTTKWLNLHSLCTSLLPLVGADNSLERVYYFSALAQHLSWTDPHKVKRHRDYITCLESVGVVKHLSRFKPKTLKYRYHNLRMDIKRYEEKETDVAIASKLFELLHNNKCDVAVLITGDTDLIPAVTTAQQIHPDKKILFAFPHKRKNTELASLFPDSFRIRARRYTRHQFPDPVLLRDGTKINKPSSW